MILYKTSIYILYPFSLIMWVAWVKSGDVWCICLKRLVTNKSVRYYTWVVRQILLFSKVGSAVPLFIDCTILIFISYINIIQQCRIIFNVNSTDSNQTKHAYIVLIEVAVKAVDGYNFAMNPNKIVFVVKSCYSGSSWMVGHI